MPKEKFYVVWVGRKTGIFKSWDKCNAQVYQFPKAKYISFKTYEMAEKAYNDSWWEYIGQNINDRELTDEQLKLVGDPILESISVDGAWNSSTGVVEYQGVNTQTQEIIFHMGPLEDGTINIVEFISIVHALAHCKKNNINWPIYSDSITGIAWVRDKEVRTQHIRNDRNKDLFDLLDKALNWLKKNEYENKILKWETKAWGENPADFDRK